MIVARLGDTVSLRYVEEFEYYNPDTGEVWDTLEDVPEGTNWSERPTKYRDVEYTVAALVTVPYALSYRYSGDDEFILNDQTFVQDTGTDSIMYYAFDTTDQSNATMEEFPADYTQRINPELDYESKATYAAEFEGMRSMFLLLGGALSFIVGLVGVLNFFNTILTGIIARRRELAVLQAVGMTGRQLRTMLVWEGLLYALGSLVLTLILTLVLGPVTFRALEGLFWFFTYRLNLAPFLLVLSVFALLGAGIPVLTCRAAENTAWWSGCRWNNPMPERFTPQKQQTIHTFPPRQSPYPEHETGGLDFLKTAGFSLRSPALPDLKQNKNAANCIQQSAASFWHPLGESNPQLALRRGLLYPFN